MRDFKLTGGQKENLRKKIRESSEPRLIKRALALLLANDADMDQRALARDFQVDARTIRRWISGYRKKGLRGLCGGKPGGRRRKLPAWLEDQWKEILKKNPQRLGYLDGDWTYPMLKDYLARRYKIHVCINTIRASLQRHRLVLSRPKLVIASPDPKKKRNYAESNGIRGAWIDAGFSYCKTSSKSS